MFCCGFLMGNSGCVWGFWGSGWFFLFSFLGLDWLLRGIIEYF